MDRTACIVLPAARRPLIDRAVERPNSFYDRNVSEGDSPNCWR